LQSNGNVSKENKNAIQSDCERSRGIFNIEH